MKESREEELDSQVGEEIFCAICGGVIETFWDSRYKGARATCKSCGINWSES